MIELPGIIDHGTKKELTETEGKGTIKPTKNENDHDHVRTFIPLIYFLKLYQTYVYHTYNRTDTTDTVLHCFFLKCYYLTSFSVTR